MLFVLKKSACGFLLLASYSKQGSETESTARKQKDSEFRKAKGEEDTLGRYPSKVPHFAKRKEPVTKDDMLYDSI